MSETEKNPRGLETAEPEVAAEDFVSRWSQRKSEARTKQAEPQDEPVEAAEEEPVLTDADMPPLESLDQDSDFSGFLSAGVSEALRRKALRQMFHGPKFNITDGLTDYSEDYSVWEPLGDVVTCDMRHAMERMKEKLQQALEDSTEQPTDDSPAESGLTRDANEPSEETETGNQTTEIQDDPGKS